MKHSISWFFPNGHIILSSSLQVSPLAFIIGNKIKNSPLNFISTSSARLFCSQFFFLLSFRHRNKVILCAWHSAELTFEILLLTFFFSTSQIKIVKIYILPFAILATTDTAHILFSANIHIIISKYFQKVLKYILVQKIQFECLYKFHIIIFWGIALYK